MTGFLPSGHTAVREIRGEFLDGRVVLHPGDSAHVVRELSDAAIDSVVTDPPYALVSITKRFGQDGAAPARTPAGGSGAYARASAGFMGKRWDTGEVAFDPAFWVEVLRVLKPGGHVVAFGGTRTYHRLACAIEDAGFEVRDQIGWAYGSGFPKSHNQKGDWQGWGTALKPAWEPIVLARKPLVGTVAENVLQHGTGALNIDGCRVAMREGDSKPLFERSARSVSRENYRTGGGIVIGASTEGRWPANIVHDGSEEVVGAFPDAPGQQRAVGPEHGAKSSVNVFGDYGARELFEPRSDGGSAARFFYAAKADADDRIGSKHPTVKPVDLMRWLVRLVTAPGGTVLDPFAGTGTTGAAAYLEGCRAILIEREAEYQADIARRMDLMLAGPDEKRHATLRARGRVEAAGPLFAEAAE